MDLLPLHAADPVPVKTTTGHIDLGIGVVVTAIFRRWEGTRGWREGTAPGRCRLCAKCTVDRDGDCVVMIDRDIPSGECAAWSRAAFEAEEEASLGRGKVAPVPAGLAVRGNGEWGRLTVIR